MVLHILLGFGWLAAAAGAAPPEHLCVMAKPSQRFREARYIMMARVTEARQEGDVGTFKVSAIRVWKGGKRQLVLTTKGSYLEYYPMTEGKAYVVFADGDPQEITKCSAFTPVISYHAEAEIKAFDLERGFLPLRLAPEDRTPPR